MKNLMLEHYKEQIENTREAANAVIAGLEVEAKKIFELQMEFKKVELNALQAALDASKQLADHENDEYPHRWVRADFSTLVDVTSEFEKMMLKEYLSENYFIDVDYKNDVASTSEGPCIAICEDGNVLDQDSGKWIISNTQYQTKKELFELIEKHMESSGYFPSVIKFGRYGVEGYVNTQQKGL